MFDYLANKKLLMESGYTDDEANELLEKLTFLPAFNNFKISYEITKALESDIMKSLDTEERKLLCEAIFCSPPNAALMIDLLSQIKASGKVVDVANILKDVFDLADNHDGIKSILDIKLSVLNYKRNTLFIPSAKETNTKTDPQLVFFTNNGNDISQDNPLQESKKFCRII